MNYPSIHPISFTRLQCQDCFLRTITFCFARLSTNRFYWCVMFQSTYSRVMWDTCLQKRPGPSPHSELKRDSRPVSGEGWASSFWICGHRQRSDDIIGFTGEVPGLYLHCPFPHSPFGRLPFTLMAKSVSLFNYFRTETNLSIKTHHCYYFA